MYNTRVLYISDQNVQFDHMQQTFVTRSEFRANQKYFLDEVGQGRLRIVITAGYADGDHVSFKRPHSVTLTQSKPSDFK